MRFKHHLQSAMISLSFFLIFSAGAQEKSSKQILFLTCKMKSDSISLITSDIVLGTLKNRGFSVADPIVYTVFSIRGSEVFTGSMADPLLLPYDNVDASGVLRGGVARLDSAVFVVRIPFQTGLQNISFYRTQRNGTRGRLIAMIPLGFLYRKEPPGLHDFNNGQRATMQLVYGDSTRKRVNYVVLSEGYTQAELTSGKFLTDLKKGVDWHFTCPPFNQYKNYYNVWAITQASTQSGLGGYFGSLQSGRLVYLSGTGTQTVSTVLKQLLPEYDLVLVLVNITDYGGGGAAFATATVNSQCGELIAHETGHGYDRLGDEYEDAGSVASECPNATQETNRDKIKWKVWILATTPIPTPETSAWNTVVGLFEGAQYNPTGWYRPKNNCKMRALNTPFCEVCIETIIARSYQSITPVDSFFPIQTTLDFTAVPNKKLIVVPLQPTGKTVRTSWFVNGSAGGANTDTCNLQNTVLNLGNNVIKAVVIDTTTQVKIPANLPWLSDTITWTVNVSTTDLASASSTPQGMFSASLVNKRSAGILVRFALPVTQSVHIALTDVCGKTVATLFSGIAGAGLSRMTLHLHKNLAAGMYCLKFNAGQLKHIQKVMLL